jgi:hypothetical protein
MRKALSILAIAMLVGFLFDAFTGPEETNAQRNITNDFQNGVSLYGLRVALPANMKFPEELVPLP